jgi:hypothetical protein
MLPAAIERGNGRAAIASAAACRSAGGSASRRARISRRRAAFLSAADVSSTVTANSVLPGLVPGIHVFLAAKTWMAGTSPAMTT